MAIAAVDAQAAADRARLIELLETRGTTIARELPANERDRFQELHRLNLAAIRRGELLLSHLLTDEIHHVLWSNQWGRSWEPRSGNLYGHPNGYLHEFNASAYPRSNELRREDAPAPWAFHSRIEQRPPDTVVDSWLQAETAQLQRELAAYRRDVTLVREADARGPMQGLLRTDGIGLCPYCERQFNTSSARAVPSRKRQLATWDGERCPNCRTRVELSSNPQPEYFLGHEFVGGLCRTCGCGLRAVRHFQWICKRS